MALVGGLASHFGPRLYAGLMRKVLVSGLLLLIAGGTALPGQARPGLSSGNVEYIKTVPIEAGLPTGARRVGDYLYVAGSKSFSIYDVSDAENPVLQSLTPIGIQFANEDVDTNGSILLLSGDQVGGNLYVWDVSEKQAPVKLAELGARDHTFSCVLDCTWAYGAGGSIVDLRDPTDPQLAGNWSPNSTPGFGFDVTEVAPGLVLTSSRQMMFLDARKNPADPELLALGATPDSRLIHSNRWPRRGRDAFVLVQGETPFTVRCNEGSGAFMTWDASRWKRTHTLTLLDEFRVENGTYVDGDPPAGVFGCTDMWFQEHPTFHNSGLVAVAFFEHGTRFLEVDKEGRIAQVGYFTPLGGSTIASYWITKEIVYAIDITRGIDILRYTSDPRPS